MIKQSLIYMVIFVPGFYWVIFKTNLDNEIVTNHLPHKTMTSVFHATIFIYAHDYHVEQCIC